MTVSPQEYNSVISRLINPNEFINMFRIPDNEPIYEIDLNTRHIRAPQFLSVITDHNAEIVSLAILTCIHPPAGFSISMQTRSSILMLLLSSLRPWSMVMINC